MADEKVPVTTPVVTPKVPWYKKIAEKLGIAIGESKFNRE